MENFNMRKKLTTEQAHLLRSFNTRKVTLSDMLGMHGEAIEYPPDVQAAIDAGLKPFKGTITKDGITIPVEWFEVDDNGLVYGTK